MLVRYLQNGCDNALRIAAEGRLRERLGCEDAAVSIGESSAELQGGMLGSSVEGSDRCGDEVEGYGGENEAPPLPSESLLPGLKKVCSGRVLELAKREDEIEGC